MRVGWCDDDDDDDDDEDDDDVDDDKSWLDESWRLPGSVARQAAATCVSRTNTLLPLTHKYKLTFTHELAFSTQIHSCPSDTNTF